MIVHQEKVIESDDYNLVEKLKQMEKVTQALTRKILSLEEDIVEIKNRNKMSGGCEKLWACKDVEKKLQLNRHIWEDGF